MIPHRSRVVAVAVACGVLVAACSAEEASSPASGSAIPTAAPTTTEPPPPTTTSTTTTTLAPTTTAEPPPPVAPTTAAPVPSGDPTDNVVEIFAGTDDTVWLFVGRWSGSGWEPAVGDDGTELEIASDSGTAITVSELVFGQGVGTIGAVATTCGGTRTGVAITPNPRAPEPPGYGYAAIGFEADWTARPRQAREVDTEIPAYVEAGRAVFADTGVDTSIGDVDQTVVSDLDGDGDTEVLVVFGHQDELDDLDGAVAPGFSSLLLIDPDSGATEEIEVSSSPIVDGEFEPVTFTSYRVLDVVDLNGDGFMEVVTRTWEADRAGVTVYTYDGAAMTPVLDSTCLR